MSKGEKRRFSSSFLFVAVVIALIAGLLIGHSGFNVVAAVAQQLGINTPSAVQPVNLSDVQDVYKIVKSKYNGDITDEKLQQYLSKGVAAATEDPYTEYYTVEEAEELEKDLEGNIGGGIGAELGMRSNKPTVVRPLKGTPGMFLGRTFLKIFPIRLKRIE